MKSARSAIGQDAPSHNPARRRHYVRVLFDGDEIDGQLLDALVDDLVADVEQANATHPRPTTRRCSEATEGDK